MVQERHVLKVRFGELNRAMEVRAFGPAKELSRDFERVMFEDGGPNAAHRSAIADETEIDEMIIGIGVNGVTDAVSAEAAKGDAPQQFGLDTQKAGSGTSRILFHRQQGKSGRAVRDSPTC